MQKAELRESVREAALDELFRHRQPILCVIDPRTLLVTIPQAAENRKGETWQTVLRQYPNLEFVVSDQASGLCKGVNACGREITHQYDLFHFEREIGRWLRGQEARCYELMEQVEQARRLMDAPAYSQAPVCRRGSNIGRRPKPWTSVCWPSTGSS